MTTDHILSETITLLRAKTNPAAALAFVEALLEAGERGTITIEHIDKARWKKGWDLVRKYRNRPDISFCDFLSFLVMREKRIDQALTADVHFEQVGMGFKRLFGARS